MHPVSQQLSLHLYKAGVSIPSDDLIGQCSNLFSNHYGFWREKEKDGIKPRIRLSLDAFKKGFLFDKQTCGLAVVLDRSLVIAHACYTIFTHGHEKKVEEKIPNALWITQLLVHPEARHRGIATSLCLDILKAHSSATYIGIVSFNPWAICAIRNAIAKVAQARSASHTDHRQIDLLLKECRVPYLFNKQCKSIENKEKKLLLVDTDVDIDPEECEKNRMIEREKGRVWEQLPAKHEYIAVYSIYKHSDPDEKSCAIPFSLQMDWITKAMEQMKKYLTPEQLITMIGAWNWSSFNNSPIVPARLKQIMSIVLIIPIERRGVPPQAHTMYQTLFKNFAGESWMANETRIAFVALEWGVDVKTAFCLPETIIVDKSRLLDIALAEQLSAVEAQLK